MRRINERGFTLIELLAVIVILAVLLAIAIPSVTNYINTSRKNTYINTISNYIDAARNGAISGEFAFPIQNGEATIITFDVLQERLEKGGKSSYDGTFGADDCVIIVQTRTPSDPRYIYYVYANDSKGYGLGTNATTRSFIETTKLSSVHVFQLGTAADTLCTGNVGTQQTKPGIPTQITVRHRNRN